MRNLLVAVFAFVGTVCLAAESTKAASAPKEGKNEVYIPKDLDDCFRELDKILRPEDIEKIRKGELPAIDMHFGLGMGLRNGWGLWGGSRLAKYFKEMGISHPDDMSGIILESYVRYLRKEPLRVDEQVARYKKYWEEAKRAQDAEKKAEENAKKKKD